MPKNIDFIGKNGGQGDVAGIMFNTNIGAMKPFVGIDGKSYITVHTGGDRTNPKNYETVPTTNAVLRKDEWKHLDEAVLDVSRDRLVGIQDLIDNGLTYNLGNAMGSTILETETVGDAFTADLTMDGIPRGRNDRVKFGINYLPIPIIHVDYQINARVLASSRSLGRMLDVTQAEVAARKVAEKLETMLFTDTSYSFGGGTIYSYINHPDINSVTLATDWDASAKTAAGVLADVLAMKQAAIGALHYGPYMLYICTDYDTVLDEDYDTTTPGVTIRERLLKISGIKGIKVVDTLPDNKCLLVQMTSDVVRLVDGMGIQNVEWKSEGKFVTNYKVMTIRVPQIRSDANKASGIVLLSA